MQISGTPNKFEIFQEFYYVQNGVQISYREALQLFAEMDSDTIAEFEKYYQDETGYEIIVPSGHNTDNTKGGSASKSAINIKYTLDAYAKKNGLVLDPQWAIYSAEEIIAMVDNGVNIPQEVVDIANTIMQSSTSADQAVEGEDGQEDTTLSFLELIPLAEKKIEKCDKNNEKIEKEIQDLLPEQQKRKRKFSEQMEEQRRSLKEYEAFVREWNRIQTKINNGEALSTSEARRYADLMGMFEEKKSGDNKGFSLDKREIAKSMNEINILAILGEKLADETIEIGDTLADYTSKANYKTTRSQARGEVGFLRAIIAIAQGKALAKEANITGNDTKDFTDETQQSVNDIASVLDIGGMIAGKDEVLGTEQPKEASVEGEEAVQDAEQQPAQDGQTIQETENQGESNETSAEVTEQEDFVINDKNVKELIKEAADINVDLAQQTISAVKSIRVAKDDRKFAKIAGIKVTKLVKEFQKQEEQRQERIQAMEQENKEANQELENLTGKSADELNEQKPAEKTQETDNEKVAELRQKIASNNEEIENIKVESEEAKGKFATATEKESEIISKAIPAEAEALEKDTEYKEEIIPAAKERLDFTDASGETLSKIGVYRIELGMLQIMAWQFEKGLRNVALGTISTGIGLAAQVVGDTPIAKLAEKATDKSVKEEDGAINDLTALEAEIISVTGAEATEVPAGEDEENEEGVEGAEQDEKPTAEPTVTEAPAKTAAVAQNNAQPTAKGAMGGMLAANQAEKEKIKAIMAEATTSNNNSGSTSKSEQDENPETSSSDAKKNGDKEKEQLNKQNEVQTEVNKAGAKSAKDDGKESKNIEKDEKKDAKQLEKEAKKLEEEIKKEQEEVIKLTQESQKAVEKQQEILVEYESLSAESETMMAQEEAKQMSAPKKQAAPQQKDGGQGGALASNSFTITSTPDGSDNQSKLAQNEMRINELGVEFKSQDTIVVKNRDKITSIQESINTKSQKSQKKLKLKNKKLKETEKKEKEKQKRQQKLMGAIGIAENVFSICTTTGTVMIQIGTNLLPVGEGMLATGTAMLSNPFTAAAGAALVTSSGVVISNALALTITIGGYLCTIGAIGTAACGVTKGIINIANGNLAAGLMAIGATAVTVATSFAGGSAATGSALQYVSEGLSIVSSSAELVNNVRAVQGKEANGVMSKIGTIAGVGSAATSAASSLGNLGDQNTLGKISTLTSVAGTALSSTSQLMSEFGGDEKTASILGTIGGGLQTLGSIGQLANSAANKNNEDSDNNTDENNENKTENKNKQSNETTIKDGKLIGPDGKEVKLPEGCKIKGNKVVDAKGKEVKIGADGKIKTNTQTTTDPKTTDSTNKATVKDGKIIGPDGKEVKLPNGYKVSGDKVIGPNGQEVKLDAKGNVPKAEHKKQVEEAKTAQKRQKELAKGTDNKDQKQEILNGSSERYADKSDLDLQKDQLANMANTKALDIQGEINNRNQYRNQMEFLNSEKQAKADKIGQILDITGQAANTATAVAGMFMTQNEGQVKKKQAAPGKLTKRTKEIMKKNAQYRQRRVQALARAQKYYA